MSTHSTTHVWRANKSLTDEVAEEVPVALLYNGQPHVVMMCTPDHLKDFARGFSFTEGVIGHASDIGQISLRSLPDSQSIQIDVQIAESCMKKLEGRTRNLQGRTGCGMCGEQSIEAAIRPVSRVPAGSKISPAAIRRALDGLQRHQPINALTGAVHAAAWASEDGLIIAAREDVGRHNALDKLIGSLMRRGTDLARGFGVISSRASYEMVQKAACVGMPMLVAISAPTAMAVRLAEQSGLTLIGFARGDSRVIYSCPSRVAENS